MVNFSILSAVALAASLVSAGAYEPFGPQFYLKTKVTYGDTSKDGLFGMIRPKTATRIR